MLSQTIFVSLLLSLALSGCLGATPEVPTGDLEDDNETDELDWQQTIENTTYLVRIEAHEDFTIHKFVPERPEGIFWSIFTIVGKVPNIHAYHGPPPIVSIQDHDIAVPYPQITPDPPPETERTYGPGTYYVVLDSKGTETLFTLNSTNARMDVLAIDPNMANYRWHYDGDWDYHKHINVKSRRVLHASTHIPLHNNYTLTFVDVSGDPWDIDLDPVCKIQTEEYFQGGEWWWIVSDGPIDVEAKTKKAFVAGAGLYFYTLDLPLDVPDTGCWIHDDWKERND